MKVLIGGFAVVVLSVGASGVVPRASISLVPASSACEDLTSLSRPQVQITRAQLVPPGAFAATPAGILAPGAPSFRPYNALPAFCRVMATLAPSSDSNITIEVWMPADGWNGKFDAVGNGGWAGNISVQALAGALGRGYAVAATDTGHSGGDGSFAFNHPEKLIDFSYRAVHEMTIEAKHIVQTYYGRPPATLYFDGCSTGGRQGLKEAQRYPADYDGIIAGAPANFMTHLMALSLSAAKATLVDPASYISKDKFAVLHRAALDACDADDGVVDGVIDDPTRCRFDPKAIQCRAGDEPTCLTAKQVEAARQIYAPVKNPRTGDEIFPGLEPGSELGWSGLAGGPAPFSIATDYFKFIVFKNPAWDFRTFDLDKDVARADAMDAGADNATDPDLRAFFGRGGKLLLYDGWIDQLISPQNTTQYYASVVKAAGGAATVNRSMRLFMIPGAVHCATTFDRFAVMEPWVERGVAPAQIVSSQIANDVGPARARLLCPYPQVATYRGSGDTRVAASYVCPAR